MYILYTFVSVCSAQVSVCILCTSLSLCIVHKSVSVNSEQVYLCVLCNKSVFRVQCTRLCLCKVHNFISVYSLKVSLLCTHQRLCIFHKSTYIAQIWVCVKSAQGCVCVQCTSLCVCIVHNIVSAYIVQGSVCAQCIVYICLCIGHKSDFFSIGYMTSRLGEKIKSENIDLESYKTSIQTGAQHGINYMLS